MRLRDTSLCVECEMLVSSGEARCPSCTCTVLIPLSLMIQPLTDREQVLAIQREDQ